MSSKRSELANLLRGLADYIDRHPDPELAPILERAAALMRTVVHTKKNPKRLLEKYSANEIHQITEKLRSLPSREEGDCFLQSEAPNRKSLEILARYLQLPVQREDSVERLREKIIESTIGSRLRSDAIQGK